jgi:lactoylglutathione lyase
VGQRFYKTFIRARDMVRSKAFYESLGFEPAPGDPRPTRAFFWIDPERTQLLVLAQETPDRPWSFSHIGYEVGLERLRTMRSWLEARGIDDFIADFGRDPVEPIVHNWVPSACISVHDPDGAHVEFAARLPYEPIPEERIPPGTTLPMYLSEWERLRAKVSSE